MGSFEMKSVEETLQALSRAVMHEARTKAEQIVENARSNAESIRQDAQKRAKAERAGILARARKEAEDIRNQAVAAAQLQAQTLQLERREELLDSVFDAVHQRLEVVPQWTDYDQIVHRLIIEAVSHLGAEETRIRADEKTRMLLTSDVLGEIAKKSGVKVQLGPALEHGTGVIVETLDRHRQYDNTLEARLRRQQDRLRSPVYHLLMGESL
jgi:vacuolar-type H+-ATPase subunit E/Vma4